MEQVPRTCLLEHLHDSSSCPEKQRCSLWGNPALWSQQGRLRSRKGHLYCRERNHPWTTLYYCSVYWLAKIFAEIAVARVGFIAQSHALGPWGNGKADIPCKTPWVCCKLSRGGREGITPEQQYLNRSAGQYECAKPSIYTPGPPIQGGLLAAEMESRFSLWSQRKLPWECPTSRLHLSLKQLEEQQEGNPAPFSLAEEADPVLSHTAWCFIHRHNQVQSTRPGLTSSRSSTHLTQGRPKLLQTLYRSPSSSGEHIPPSLSTWGLPGCSTPALPTQEAAKLSFRYIACHITQRP